MSCEFCAKAEGHHPVCPMFYILSDPNRKMAFDMGSGVATSDWIDAALLVGRIGGNVRQAFIESWSLLAQYHDRRKVSP